MLVTFRRQGKSYTRSVHRVVAIAFLGPSGLEINHRDGDKRNNLSSNLEWVTSQQNNDHKCGVLGFVTHGESSGMHWLKEAQIRCLFMLKKAGVETKILTTGFQVDKSTIYNLIAGRRWRHLMLGEQQIYSTLKNS
jgi:hypothetical protein